MATINIGQSNAGDEFYRYKMPALQSKAREERQGKRIEGRGNGIKTNVMNMVDVAKALGRPASYTTKYFGTELGAQTKFDEASGLAIVNGAHETNRLSQLLEGFIKRFVQCGQCNNPETDIVLTKKETIELKCKACGAVTQVDMRHKLCTFILKNPPVIKDKSKKLRRAEKERMTEGEAIDKAEKEARKKAKDKKEKKEKKEKKSKKEAGEEGEGNGGSAPAADADSGSGSDDEDEDDEDDDDVKWSTDTSAAAAAARAAEQLTDGAAAMVTVTAVKTADASVDDAAKRLAGVTVAEEEDGDEEDDDPLVTGLRVFAASHGAAEVAAHLKGMKADNNEHRMHILVAALLDSSESAPALSKQVAAKAAVLKACVPDAPSAGAMLASLERWVVDDAPHVLASKQGIATGLNALYDADVADEPAILAWADNAAAARKFGVSPEDAKAVRKAAAPFVEWLRTADSEDEDSD